jgi:predicted nucleotidyltransferase
MRKEIQNNLQEIWKLCKAGSVKELYLFGSGLHDSLPTFRDIDLAVVFSEDMDPVQRGEAYFNLKYQLEDLLNKEVDLVSYPAIKNTVFKALVDGSKEIIYAA